MLVKGEVSDFKKLPLMIYSLLSDSPHVSKVESAALTVCVDWCKRKEILPFCSLSVLLHPRRENPCGLFYVVFFTVFAITQFLPAVCSLVLDCTLLGLTLELLESHGDFAAPFSSPKYLIYRRTVLLLVCLATVSRFLSIGASSDETSCETVQETHFKQILLFLFLPSSSL